MKTKNSIFSLSALLLSAAILFSFTTLPDPVNFSGDWKLDESKSELGEMGGRGIARTLKVEQKEKTISITRTTPGRDGGDPVVTTLTLSFDGAVTESEGFMGSKRKSTCKWSDDGKTMTVSSVMNFERDGQSMEIKGTETWTLNSDGLLSLVTFSSSPRGEFTTKAIYNK
jgi:hypothetical protein